MREDGDATRTPAPGEREREAVLGPYEGTETGATPPEAPARAPPPGPPATGVAPAAGDVPPEPSVPSRMVFTLAAVAGGILFLAFLVGIGGAPGFAGLLMFIGLTLLVVVLIVGAAGATDLPPEARVVMGALAALIILTGASGLFWVYDAPYTVCGAIAAVPGLLALRAFPLLRDTVIAGLAPPAPAAPARARPAPRPR